MLLRKLGHLCSVLTVIAAPTSYAIADVGIEMQVDGYSELFKECEFGFAWTDFDAGFDRVLFSYEVHVRGGLVKNCRATLTHDSTETECQGVPGVDDDHTCEELSKVKPVGLSCFENETKADCGELLIRGAEPFSFD
ncbi:MAG: hypothetical protein AAF439_16125 [Pseudomonadota bacterium]